MRSMPQLKRLLSYLRPYTLPFLASVVLMATVGALEAFRLLLLGPIFDKVLNPAAPNSALTLFNIPGADRTGPLHWCVTWYCYDPLGCVTVALIGATVTAGSCHHL